MFEEDPENIGDLYLDVAEAYMEVGTLIFIVLLSRRKFKYCKLFLAFEKLIICQKVFKTDNLTFVELFYYLV